MTSPYVKITVDGRTCNLHRYLMEQHLGRPLDRGEVVHHVNHNKRDNRIENLVVVSHREHSTHHNQKHPLVKTCVVCGIEFTPHPTKRATKLTCSRTCFRQRERDMHPGLTDAQCDEIRACHAAGGVTLTELGRRYGVTRSRIGQIVRERLRTPQPTGEAALQ